MDPRFARRCRVQPLLDCVSVRSGSVLARNARVVRPSSKPPVDGKPPKTEATEYRGPAEYAADEQREQLVGSRTKGMTVDNELIELWAAPTHEQPHAGDRHKQRWEAHDGCWNRGAPRESNFWLSICRHECFGRVVLTGHDLKRSSQSNDRGSAAAASASHQPPSAATAC